MGVYPLNGFVRWRSWLVRFCIAGVSALWALAAFGSTSWADTPLVFDVEDGVGVALEDSAPEPDASNLVVIEADGETRDALVSGSAAIDRFLIGPDDRIYVLFRSRVDLDNATSSSTADGCLLAEIDPDTGIPDCIDQDLQFIWWNTLSGKNPAIQFDQSGAIYYLGVTNEGKTVLRKHTDGVSTNLITDQIRIEDFLVVSEDTVLLSGTTTATGASWVRRLKPGGGLQSLRATSSQFMRKFADGNVYMGMWGGRGNFGVRRYLTASQQLESKYWIGGSINDELNPDTYFDVYDFCSGTDRAEREGFCGTFGTSVNATFGGYVIVGYGANAVLAQYYPDLQFPASAVHAVSVASSADGNIALAGLNRSGQNILTLFHPADGTETQLVGPSNEIEIYHLNYIEDSHKLLFDGLRFADNKYVLGEITLESQTSEDQPSQSAGDPSAKLMYGAPRAQAAELSILPTVLDRKWQDFQTFGEETVPLPLPPVKPKVAPDTIPAVDPVPVNPGPPARRPSAAKARIIVGKVTLNRKKGTAFVLVRATAAGTLTVSGQLVLTTRKTLSKAGWIRIQVRPKGKAAKTLRKKGRATVRATFVLKTANGQAGATRTFRLIR